MISLKAVIVNAPLELRETLQPLSKMASSTAAPGLRHGPVTTGTTPRRLRSPRQFRASTEPVTEQVESAQFRSHAYVQALGLARRRGSMGQVGGLRGRRHQGV